MHPHNCRCFQKHLIIVILSLRALCFAPGGHGSIWNELGAPAGSTGESGRFACGFRTNLPFADGPGDSNYFNYKNDGGKNAPCCAVTGRKLLTSPGVADTYTFLMNTSNTLPESYQQRVYKNTHATVKCQIQEAEEPTPAMVISVEAANDDNAILLNYLASEVALEEPDIGSTVQRIPIDNNSTDDELYIGIPWSSGDYKDAGDDSEYCDNIASTGLQRRPDTWLERLYLGTCDVDGYEEQDGNNADAAANQEEDESQANDGSMQNAEDRPANQSCWLLWVRGSRRRGYWCGACSISIRWWINAECGWLSWKPVMSTGMSARMVTMRIRMSRKNHRKPMMDQRRI